MLNNETMHYNEYLALAELSFDPILICCENIIMCLNPAGIELLGAKDKSEIVGKSILDFLHADRSEISTMAIMEKQFIRLDGSSLTVKARAIPVVYNNKSAIYFIVRDITAQRILENSLYESEYRNQRMLQRSPDAIIIHSNGIITYVNDAMLKLVRARSQDQVLGNSIYKFIHQDFHEMTRKLIALAERTQDPLDFIASKLVTTDGDIIEIDISSEKVFNTKGKISIQSILRDTTQRFTEEEELRESSRRYQRLIKFLPEPIVVTDNGIIIYTNISAVKLIGFTDRDELIGRSFFDFLHPDHHEESEDIFSQVMLSDDSTNFQERKLICCNGELIDVEVCSIRIHNFMGKSVALSVLRDLTERKNAEELLIRSEKLSVVGQLASGVAHEIRNPLTVLKGFTQLLQKEMGSEHSYLATMLNELNRINDIANEFMTLAKPHFVQFRNKDIFAILNSVNSIMKTQAILMNVNIIMNCHHPLPLIYCDENQLKQVFINVIKNAIEAMPLGGNIDISVKLKSPHQLLIHIQDQGEGIPEEVITRVGEPFYTTKESGTGLGLMICQRIITAHKGTLQISSRGSLGTIVDIILPVDP
jgi:PAS domain S-box-containing protein